MMACKFAAAVCFGLVSVQAIVIPTDANVWGALQRITGSQCIDESETGAYFRKGNDPNKLAIYLMGGGACFSPASCDNAVSSTHNADRFVLTLTTGIFNSSDATNPLKDYSFVLILDCSGDLFLGDWSADVRYWGRKQFRGRRNLELMLEQVQPMFADITHIVVAGEGAGGYGALGNFDFIVQKWLTTTDNKLSDMTMIDDGGTILSDAYIADCLQLRFNAYWDLTSTIPADCANCLKPSGSLSNVHAFLEAKYPTANLGLITSAEDSETALFYGGGANECNGLDEEYPTALPNFAAGVTDLLDNILGPRFASFKFDGDEQLYLGSQWHDIQGLGTSKFDKVVNGMTLKDWVTSLMAGEIIKISSSSIIIHTANPTAGPTMTPSANPTAGPTITPTANPSATLTAGPTTTTTTTFHCGCGSDAECNEGSFCSGEDTCRAYAAEGASCGGFAPMDMENRCPPSMTCDYSDNILEIAGQPGVCAQQGPMFMTGLRCEDSYSRITSKSECEAAASALGLDLKTSSAKSQSRNKTIRGCYTKKGKLFFNSIGVDMDALRARSKKSAICVKDNM